MVIHPTGKPTPLMAVYTLLANALPLYGVLAWNWDIFDIFFLFWFENVAIGFFVFAQILAYGLRRTIVDTPEQPRRNPISLLGTVYMAVFFTLHFGIFTLCHGVFVFGLFGNNSLENEDFININIIMDALTRDGLLLACVFTVAAVMLNAFYQFVHKNAHAESEGKILFSPYGRVVILHLVIIFGGLLTEALGAPIWALILLIGLKSAYDLRIVEIKLNEKETI